MNKEMKLEITSAGLHVLAMLFMLCDHAWALLFPSAEWLTCVGRIAFPIFAFLLVEGYYHTHDLKRYLKRMLIAAIISEIPFDLMYNGTVFYPLHQNVLWTFLIGLLIMYAIDLCRQKYPKMVAIVLSLLLTLFGFLLGTLILVDYYGVGVLTILAFYFFRGHHWQERLLQVLCLYILNVKMLGGYYYEWVLFGHTFEIVQQGFALLALIPIWLYHGKQGYHTKAFQYACYGFYPLHMLLLRLLRNLWFVFNGF